jgi:hypothetical protein
MRRRDLLRTIALTPFAARLHWPSTAAAYEANAASAYRAAIAALPIPSESAAAAFYDAAAGRLDLNAAILVRKGGRALDALARGARAKVCYWGDSWTRGAFTVSMEQLSGVRNLCRLALLRARVALDAGRTARALDDLLATITMARHVSMGGMLIAQLVGFAVEQTTIGDAVRALPSLDPATLRAFGTRLDALPGPVSLADTIRAERDYMLESVCRESPEEYPEDHVALVRSFFDQLLAAIEAEDMAATAALRADTEARDFFPSFDLFVMARRITEVRVALFRSAVSVAADGPGAIAAAPDPADGLPFDLESWAAGFELKSRFGIDGRPMESLLVGDRG